MMPHPWKLFGQQCQADQDKDPALDHGQKAADDTKEQKEGAEGKHHTATEMPDHDGILADGARA